MSETMIPDQGAALAPPKQRTYGHWQRPQSPGLLGLGTVGTIAALVGVVVVLIATMFNLLIGFVMLLVLSVAFTPLMLKIGGRSGAQHLTAWVSWRRGRRRRQHIFRSGALGSGGETTLPGLLASARMYAATDAYGQSMGMLHMPATRHYTVVLRCDADGAALVDREQVDSWVAHWGAWLASLSHEPGLDAASVTIETAPDSGERLRAEVDQLIDPAAPALARQVLAETAQSYPAGGAQVSTRVALTYKPGTARSKDEADEMAVEIGTRLPGLADALATTGAGAAFPLSPSTIAEAVRVAYDPASAQTLDQARRQRPGVDHVGWADAGPVAAQEHWDRYQHDSGLSVTWEMAEAPRGAVLANVLGQLLAPHRDVPRKRVTLIYRPHDPGAAARLVDRDVRDANFRATKKRAAAARDDLAVQAARQSAQEEAAGAGVVRFSILVTATVSREADLRQAIAVIDNLSATARIRLRRVYGGQSAAFAAALGIGVILPSHVLVPRELSENL